MDALHFGKKTRKRPLYKEQTLYLEEMKLMELMLINHAHVKLYDSQEDKELINKIIRWRTISMRAGLAFLQFDWSKAGLSMDLPVFVYSHTKTGFKFFQYREDIGSFLCAWRSSTSNHAERTSQGSCFV